MARDQLPRRWRDAAPISGLDEHDAIPGNSALPVLCRLTLDLGLIGDIGVLLLLSGL